MLTAKYLYITDQAFLRPTLLSVWSLLSQLKQPSQVHLWGYQLNDKDWQTVARVFQASEFGELCPYEMTEAEMSGALGPSASTHVSATTLGRLLAPTKLSGRILYIDGDTLVTGDPSEAFTLDLQGCPIAGVRDYVMTKRFVRGDKGKADTRAKMKRCEDLIGKREVGDYINAGVLIIDTDAIRAKPQLSRAMADLRKAASLPFGDQDHLNASFTNQIHYLNPAWNASWGRLARQRSFIRRCGGSDAELVEKPPIIMHYHGPDKPWAVPRYDFWTAKGRAVLRYRRAMRQYLHQFPDLSL